MGIAVGEKIRSIIHFLYLCQPSSPSICSFIFLSCYPCSCLCALNEATMTTTILPTDWIICKCIFWFRYDGIWKMIVHTIWFWCQHRFLLSSQLWPFIACCYAATRPFFHHSHCTLTTFFIIKYSERDDEGQASKIRETQQKKYSLHSAHAHAQSPQANRRGRRSFTLCRNRITKVSSPHPEHCRSAFTHKFIGVWRTNSR